MCLTNYIFLVVYPVLSATLKIVSNIFDAADAERVTVFALLNLSAEHY